MADDLDCLARPTIEAMHDRLLDTTVGSTGVRDEDGLASTLARPQHLWAYVEPDLCDIAAAYASGIAANHPFTDGNKRTVLMPAYVFLARNGSRLSASEAEATHTMVGLAAGEMDAAAFATWLLQNTEKS